MRAFALEQLDERGRALAALTALAEWVTTITDLPFADPCNAAVERNSIRLEREADNWREAVMLAARAAAPASSPPGCAARRWRSSCSAGTTSPTSCGRCSSCATTTPRQRRAVLCALIVSAAGATEPAQLQAWADEIAARSTTPNRPGSAG